MYPKVMEKMKYLIASILGAFTLVSCSNNFSDDKQTIVGNEKPATMKEIKFDGSYVQTNDSTWAIAFESYAIEDNSLVIIGNFYIPNELNIIDIKNLEMEFNKNKENLPYVISYYKSSYNVNDAVYSNLENTKWNLKSLINDNLCYFSINIDISPLVENNKILGELVLNSYFDVFCIFRGEKL